jgi:hypothetical protein
MSSGHYKEYDPEPGLDAHNSCEAATERVGLLSDSQHLFPTDDGPNLRVRNGTTPQRYVLKHILASFVGGIVACLAVQLSLFGTGCRFQRATVKGEDKVDVYAPPWVGSTTVHNYPPPSPTNDFPELFPSEYVLFLMAYSIFF